MQQERDELYSRFTKAIHEVQQKSGFKNLLLEKKLTALADTLEKKVRSTCHLAVGWLAIISLTVCAYTACLWVAGGTAE